MRGRGWRALAIMGSLLLLLLAAAPQTHAQGSALPDVDFHQGIRAYEEGNLDEALSRLRGFAIRNPASPRLSDTYLYLARIFHDQGRCDEAALYLRRLDGGEPSSQIALLEGSCQVQQGQATAAVTRLLPLQSATLDDAERALLNGRLGQAFAQLDEPLRALLFFHQALLISGVESRWFEPAYQLLRQQRNEAFLEEVAFMFASSALGQAANLQLAESALARGDGERARALAATVLNDPTAFPHRARARAILERMRPGDTPHLQQDSVGVILPFSGRFASFGQMVKRGLDLALQLHNQANPPVRFIYRDSGAEGELAADAVSTLVSSDGVVAIIGPLTANAALNAAQRAEREGVPLLSLSQREGLPQQGRYVFRHSLTNALQARELARHAVLEKGLERFAILYPENRAGQEMRDLFIREVSLLGGRVVARQGYPESQSDFRRQIKLLMGQDPNRPDAPRAQQQPPPPPLPYQALFIPDFADRAGTIAPQLAFYGMQGMVLLGINSWNSPDLIRMGGRFVEGAVFVDGFFRDSQAPLVRDFVSLFEETYGEAPSILEAQAFDAAAMVLHQLRHYPGGRQALRDALAGLRHFPGVSGYLSMDGEGEVQRRLFVIEVRGGQLVEVP